MSSINGIGSSRVYLVAKATREPATVSDQSEMTQDRAPATQVALSAADPVPTSTSFADVTRAARAALTANEAAMSASGHVLGMGENQGTQADIDSAFAGLDRRSLFAVASNSGGLFTDAEQTFARSVMSQQQAAAAMGLGNPASFNADPSAGYLAGIDFLDTVSPEEKASDNWRVNRAGLQASYLSNVADDHPGTTPEDVDSGDPVVAMMAKAIAAANGTWSSTTDGSYVDDVGRISLFADGSHDAELAAARSQSRHSDRVDVTA